MNYRVVVAVLTVPDRLFQIVAAATANARSDALIDDDSLGLVLGSRLVRNRVGKVCLRLTTGS